MKEAPKACLPRATAKSVFIDCVCPQLIAPVNVIHLVVITSSNCWHWYDFEGITTEDLLYVPLSHECTTRVRGVLQICCRFGRRRGDRDESINNLFFILKSSFILTYHPRIRHLELSSPLILPW
ncbi:hypothetical protein HZ326_31279 [Fusarium oxysporum f. sp. albedinis]|nr:hypothetical protein HZ326_31279 [Fusarium oxysporum f. sp. albedinis]